jgi:hypothetical protein
VEEVKVKVGVYLVFLPYAVGFLDVSQFSREPCFSFYRLRGVSIET